MIDYCYICAIWCYTSLIIEDICFIYVLKFNFSNIHFFNFSFSNLYRVIYQIMLYTKLYISTYKICFNDKISICLFILDGE